MPDLICDTSAIQYLPQLDLLHVLPALGDEFLLLDLREPKNCEAALSLGDGTFDEVYQLAADMGGMGFIPFAECEIMHNNALINIH